MTKTISLEQQLEKLDTIVEKMEAGNLSLEQSLESFEEGIKLIRQCQQTLNDAEMKVKILTENSATADLKDFDNE